jgi:hypothetical protein
MVPGNDHQKGRARNEGRHSRETFSGEETNDVVIPDQCIFPFGGVGFLRKVMMPVRARRESGLCRSLQAAGPCQPADCDGVTGSSESIHDKNWSTNGTFAPTALNGIYELLFYFSPRLSYRF